MAGFSLFAWGRTSLIKSIEESVPWLTGKDTRGLLCSSHLWSERTNEDSPRGYSENQIRSNIVGLSPSHLLFANHNRFQQFPDHDQLFLASGSLFVFLFFSSLIFFFSFISFIMIYFIYNGFPGGTSGRELAYQCRRHNRCTFDPWVGKIPWRRLWQPTPVFLPGESHGQTYQL